MIPNYLSPLEFQISVARLPNTQFFTQSIQIPGVSTSPLTTENPFNKIFHTPDKLNYFPLSLSFIIDEAMLNYREILTWIEGTSYPQDFTQYRNLNNSDEGLKSDISVIVLNSHKNPNILITYTDCFPVALSGVRLDTTQQDLIYPTAEVEFIYNYFKITTIT